MLGGLFAGTEEAPGETVLFQGRSYKSYRGMGSLGAMQQGAADRYFQETPNGEWIGCGKTGAGRHRRPRAVQGAGCGGGAPTHGRAARGDGLHRLRHHRGMRHKAEFVQITAGGIRESHVHDVQITREAPNYHMG
jgi:IMP dehydrogenase